MYEILKWLGSFFWHKEESQFQIAIKQRENFQSLFFTHYLQSMSTSVFITHCSTKYEYKRSLPSEDVSKRIIYSCFSWCYYPDGDISYEDLDYCKDVICDGYSALGAVIIGRRDQTIKHKREIINTLMEEGFQLTKDDLILARLEIYDALGSDGKTNIMLFLNNEESLLIDVKKYIVRLLLDIYKKEFWPLPL